MERALHDAMCVIKRVLESNDVVPGGGAVRQPYILVLIASNIKIYLFAAYVLP